jgi:hypothetical protein
VSCHVCRHYRVEYPRLFVLATDKGYMARVAIVFLQNIRDEVRSLLMPHHHTVMSRQPHHGSHHDLSSPRSQLTLPSCLSVGAGGLR